MMDEECYIKVLIEQSISSYVMKNCYEHWCHILYILRFFLGTSIYLNKSNLVSQLD